MRSYECKICTFSTTLKSNYNRHILTSKHQKKNNEYKTIPTIILKKNENLTTNDHKMTSNDHNLTTNDHNCGQKLSKSKSNFQCDYCGKMISTKGHLTRHIKKYCSKKKETSDNTLIKDILFEQKKMYEEERKELYKQINTLLDKVGNTTNIQSNIKNTYHLNNYGNENMNHITDKMKDDLLKIPFGMIPKLIEAVHFNDKHPENKNISLCNVRDNKIKIFSDNKWIYKDKEQTISDLVDGKYYIMDSHFDEKSGNIQSDNKQNYIKFKTYYDQDDKELVTKLKKECELVLLNNR